MRSIESFLQSVLAGFLAINQQGEKSIKIYQNLPQGAAFAQGS